MPVPGAQSVTPFGARLASAVRRRSSAIVVGLDPDPSRLWSGGVPVPAGLSPAAGAAFAVADHGRRVLDAVAPACVAVKLQSAAFERLGPDGLRALQAVADHARGLDLLVILDAKRGDIDVSAAAYAAATLGGTDTPWGRVDGAGADAVTVAPYMGGDSIRPFVDVARRTGAGVFVLVRTSNPGASDLQEHDLDDGEPVWSRVARLVATIGAEGRPGDSEGLDAVGAVVGATAPERLARLRELLPHAPFLLPGVGAQGGRIEDLAPAFAPGPGSALVTASRSIVDAGHAAGDDPAAAALRAAEALRVAADSLA